MWHSLLSFTIFTPTTIGYHNIFTYQQTAVLMNPIYHGHLKVMNFNMKNHKYTNISVKAGMQFNSLHNYVQSWQ